MNGKYYNKIADLMIFAVGLKKDDKLSVQLNHDCREAVKPLVYKAYEKGASYVGLKYLDDFVNAAAISAGKTSIEYPEFFKQSLIETSSPEWKKISYLSFSDEGIYENLPGDISTSYFKHHQKIMASYRKKMLGDAFSWTLTFIPAELTASKVFPDKSMPDALEAYWKKVIKIMRLDLDDPVAFWKEKFKKDAQRSSYLTNLAPDYLEFKGPGTDFKIGINKSAFWIGGMKKSQAGEWFAANLPTDEIFTSPDFRKAEGRVSLTKPFVMHQNLGQIPQNAWFEFKDGKVIDYGAEEGKESLDNLFARDERARYLGEVALVDPHSPFADGGLVYYNGLYDENAACHIALGASYSGTLKEPGEYSDEQMLEMGMNVSAIHEDMMIGSPEVDVKAVTPDGQSIDIIKDGKFLI